MLNSYGVSFQGRRNNNQDSFCIYAPNEHTTFLAVADGMGGSVGGEIASKLVIQAAKKIIKDSFNAKVNESELKIILIKIFSESQKAIRAKIEKESKLKGMGTTLCCVLIFNEFYVWGNIGDSRVYHFSKNNFHKITKDHTHIEEHLIDENKQVSEDIIKKYGHLLTRSLDGGNDEPDIYPEVIPYEKLNRGEGFLLCSDGLLLDKYGDENQLFHKYLLGTKSLKEFAENLISNAYTMGSTDNITCVTILNGKIKRKNNDIILYKYPPKTDLHFARKKKKTKPINLLFILVLLSVLIIAFVIAF